MLAAHPHLAVPAAQMKLPAPGVKMIMISHGIEAWSPLPWFRRLRFSEVRCFSGAQPIHGRQNSRRARASKRNRIRVTCRGH